MLKQLEIKPGQTVLFIGDSITDAGRTLRSYKPFGFGFVHFIANYLLAKYPTYNLKIINRGISGNTIRDLKSRWKKDTLDHKPDILSILIGVNDVWRQFATEDELPHAVQLEEYESTYRQILNETKQKCSSRLVICQPFMFCDDSANPMFARLRDYIETVDRITKEYDCLLIPFQNQIDALIKQVPPQKWSADSVHPELWAHSWLAQQWLNVTKS
jgi:acyl-CoA thioesterase-1